MPVAKTTRRHQLRNRLRKQDRKCHTPPVDYTKPYVVGYPTEGFWEHGRHNNSQWGYHVRLPQERVADTYREYKDVIVWGRPAREDGRCTIKDIILSTPEGVRVCHLDLSYYPSIGYTTYKTQAEAVTAAIRHMGYRGFKARMPATCQ